MHFFPDPGPHRNEHQSTTAINGALGVSAAASTRPLLVSVWDHANDLASPTALDIPTLARHDRNEKRRVSSAWRADTLTFLADIEAHVATERAFGCATLRGGATPPLLGHREVQGEEGVLGLEERKHQDLHGERGNATPGPGELHLSSIPASAQVMSPCPAEVRTSSNASMGRSFLSTPPNRWWSAKVRPAPTRLVRFRSSRSAGPVHGGVRGGTFVCSCQSGTAFKTAMVLLAPFPGTAAHSPAIHDIVVFGRGRILDLPLRPFSAASIVQSSRGADPGLIALARQCQVHTITPNSNGGSGPHEGPELFIQPPAEMVFLPSRGFRNQGTSDFLLGLSRKILHCEIDLAMSRYSVLEFSFPAAESPLATASRSPEKPAKCEAAEASSTTSYSQSCVQRGSPEVARRARNSSRNRRTKSVL